MSHQAKWFRQTAHQLTLLHFHKLDLSIPRLEGVAEAVLPDAVVKAKQQRLDLSHPATWWDLLHTDAILYIEDQSGKVLRVAVCITTSERQAQQVYQKLKTPEFALLRDKLALRRHWVFLVSKDAPHPLEQWVDLLYSCADSTATVLMRSLVE